MSQQQLFSTPQTEMTSDDCYTPPEVFDRLGVVFDVDVCAPPGGVPWIPAKSYLTQAENGLATNWAGNVWMNPPFSNVEPWVDKWLNHANGIALLPCVKHSRWVETLWTSTAKVAWINQTELKFITADGQKQIWPIVWLWAIGQSNEKALQSFAKLR